MLVILAAGGLVLVAGVQASVDARMHESAILRALGAQRRLILGGLLIEFATLGLFAGLLATVAAELSVYILQSLVMDMTYAPSPWIWPVGVCAGAADYWRPGSIQLSAGGFDAASDGVAGA